MKTLFQHYQKTKAIALFVFCLSLIQTLSAQNTLSIDTLILPATGTMNDSDSVVVRVKNLDVTSYSGPLYIYFSTDSANFLPFFTETIPTVTLPPQGTITHTTTINFSPISFNTGSNIVVVWSSGNGRFAADSAKDTVTIMPAGIHEHDPMLSFSILPSLAHDFIQIHVNQPSLFKNKLQTLYITDVLGRPVYTEPFNGDAERRIPVDHLPPGLYFLELRYENKVSATQKFVRTD